MRAEIQLTQHSDGKCIACDSFELDYTGSLDTALAQLVAQYSHVQGVTTKAVAADGSASASN